MAKKVIGQDPAGELLSGLIKNFSLKSAVAWLERKFASFDTSKERSLSVSENKNDNRFFKSARILGFIRDLPDSSGSSVNCPVLVAAVEMKNDITERTSRQTQFNFAKRTLQEIIKSGSVGLNGYPSQGIFFFYDKDQFFRISLVSGSVEGRRFKFNEAKRQSFFINPERPNNVAKSRLQEPIKTFDDLKRAFSVETLTKEFYSRLFEWYEWAMKSKTGVTFPNDLADNKDDRKYNNESIIRLITRLMFTWFIRQRGLVPDEFFSIDGVKALLKKFDPKSMEDDNYYRCILQNLFFATLNCQNDKRGFRTTSGNGMCKKDWGIKTLYRYEKEFADASSFKKMMRKVPFLNCALFDCLDKQERDEDGGRTLLFDGFSDTKKRQAHVPNGLFFHPEKGIITLFDTYEFTIDENNADDADVALDPELLGKVFENLLGAFNPETSETARKSTGSFYTPREIVDYMVEESLKNYLKTKVPNLKDEWLQDLFDKTKAIEREELPFDDNVAASIRDALYACKILDPACGSGAFPMGILHCMVRLFGRLDPNNCDLNDRLIARYKSETNKVDPFETASEKAERLEALKLQLTEGQHYPDYARKLYLIENCIYGVDIQPIATQISKLRFFISLLCDQLRSNWNEDVENQGLLSLPNLEAKFVCANTLISLPETESELNLSTDGILRLREKLQENRHRIFNARTYQRKDKLKARDLEIRDEIRNTVRSTLAKPDKKLIAIQEELIKQLKIDRKRYEDAKMVKKLRPQQGSLFDAPMQGELCYEMVDENKEKRDAIDEQIRFAEKKIAAEYAKSSTARVTAIDELATKVAGWDPYDQNTSSEFFDPKWMFNIHDGFDIVIGNPPYVQVPKGIFSATQFPYSEGKDKGKQNLYKVFVEAGYNLTSFDGYTILIVQSSLMGDMSAKYTRELLLKKTCIDKIIEFPKNPPTTEGRVFKGVLQGTCIVAFKKNIPKGNEKFKISILNDITTVNNYIYEDVEQEMIVNVYPNYYEFPLVRPGYSKIVKKIKNIGATISQYLLRTAQGNINTIHLKRIQSSKKTGAFIAKGAHIHRWHIDDELFDCLESVETKKIFKENYNQNIILTQNISGTTDKHRINATPYECRNTKIVFLHSANILYLRSPEEMNFVSAVLNSTLIDWIFRITSTNNHLNMYELETLPIPEFNESNDAPIIVLVKQIMESKLKDPNADTSALEAEIDQLVYKLYGLTDEEIAIVEGRGGEDGAGAALGGAGAENRRTGCAWRDQPGGTRRRVVTKASNDEDEELE